MANVDSRMARYQEAMSVGHRPNSPVNMNQNAHEREPYCVACLGIGVNVGVEALFLAFFLLLRLWLGGFLHHWRWP